METSTYHVTLTTRYGNYPDALMVKNVEAHRWEVGDDGVLRFAVEIGDTTPHVVAAFAAGQWVSVEDQVGP